MKNQGQCSSCLAVSITVALEKALAVDNWWTQTMSEQQPVDCDTVNYGCDSGFMDSISPKRMPCARRSALQRDEEELKGFMCVTWKPHKCHGKQGHVHRQRRLCSQQQHSNPCPSSRRGRQQKTLLKFEDLCRTARHGAHTKPSDGRINLLGTGTCVKLDDAKAANSLAKALSREGSPSTLHTTRTASSFGHSGQDDV